ncbi:DgyrCDS10043 [Dimorphilus gyrociliatus]|uniref:DgyrCDS10043 n=1 Tax=Dimorphilus gyrociliatus TaxID=2664684 RepID=A0A7I8W063_9ANNE|nr:DgyrCDS10043 [Dimorphilus gyrociliatus]
MNEENNKLIDKVFSSYDENAKGFLTQLEIKFAICSLFGYKPSKYEVNSLIERYGSDHETGLNKNGFRNAVLVKFKEFSEDENIRQSFLCFDDARRGFLTLDQVYSIFVKVAPNLNKRLVENAFRHIDSDGDGRVTYNDFESMMKCAR